MRRLSFIILGLVLSVPPALADHQGERALRPFSPAPPSFSLGRLSQSRTPLADPVLQANTYEEATEVCRQLSPAGYWQLPRELDVVSIGLAAMQAILENYAPGSPLWLQPERPNVPAQQGRWSFLGEAPRLAVDLLDGPRTARVYCVHAAEVPVLFTFPRGHARLR